MPKFFYVPYKALNVERIIPCCKVDRVIIENVIFPKCLIGISKKEFALNDIDCILPNKFKEDLWKKSYNGLDVYFQKFTAFFM